jgi:CDGSH-type Zn-finger protein
MPTGHDARLEGKTAGPGFGYNRDIHLLPHKRSAWVFFGERLHEAAAIATSLWASSASRLPFEVEEAAAALQALALEFAPTDRARNAAAELAEFRAAEKGARTEIKPTQHGPLLVTNLERFTGTKGEALPTSPEIALCRCGKSRNKPYCDGTHARSGFNSDRDAEHTVDSVGEFPGAEITVHFNKLQCSAAQECANGLPSVFRHGDLTRFVTGKPWIQPDREPAEKIMAVIKRCPSGALRYTINGKTGPDHMEPPNIRIRKNGPYEVKGSIPLRTSFWMQQQNPQLYALCRCGASRNKPFCDGSHWRIKFDDGSE